MDLWIRSQDREMLKKVNVLYVVDDGEEGFSIKHYGERFGIYKTKKRALEVLDEIQNHILNLGETVLIYGKEYKEYGRVYEMPKE